MYKYDLHVHTGPISNGGEEIENHINFLRKIGFSGMVVTNHFFGGDNKLDKTLPWEEFVGEYKKDYEKGKRLARLYDFDLLFGIEEHIEGGKEILVYGVSPEFLISHSELKNASLEEYVSIIHAGGGLVFQAHPFRDRWYIENGGIFENISLLDGIEIKNAGNREEENKKAEEYNKTHKLPVVAGTDSHSLRNLGKTGIFSPVRLKTNQDLVDLLKSGNYKII